MVIQMKMLNINLRVRGLEKITYESAEENDKKPAVALVRGNRRLMEPEPNEEEPLAVLCGTTEVIEETNKDGKDDPNEETNKDGKDDPNESAQI